MIFKIGDRVKCTKKPSHHYYQFKDPNPIGKIYKVTGLGGTPDCVSLQGEKGFFGESSGLIIYKEITNDIEWLDAIRDNFKEGV